MAAHLKRKRGTDNTSSPKKHRGNGADVLSSDDSVRSEGHAISQDSEDQDEWAGLDSPPQAQDPHTPAHLVKPPTGEELRKIKDATDLYRSTSFKLQIDALLPNVRPKYNASPSLDSFLLLLHKLLMDLPPLSPQHPLRASQSLSEKGISIPYIRPLPTEETNWKVAFEPPSEILLVGSWPTKTAVKGKDSVKYEVDVAVAMPSNLFQEKDYLNGRAFQKRAYYLSVIAAALANAKLPVPCDVLYQSMSGDPRCTVLILRPDEPEGFGKLNVQIRIVPFLAQSPIPLQRLSPARSNLRITSQDDESAEMPTPIYNSAFMLMHTPKSHLLSVHALKQDVPAFTDALALLRVWANQRGYGLGSGLCVRGFEGKGMLWPSILEFLVRGEEAHSTLIGGAGPKRKPLGTGLSSYQMFKAALDFLAKHDFAEQPVFIKSKDGHRFLPRDYASHDAVFIDSTSSINLLSAVPLSSLDMLRHDAQVTLEVLDHSAISEDAFYSVFLQDHRDLFSRFDTVVRVDVSSAEMRKTSAHTLSDHGSVYNALLNSLASILRRGFGNRVKAIAILQSSSIARPLLQSLPASSSIVYIGLILDAQNAFRLVDHGPHVEDQENEKAKDFREFWGDKAELRRFKDGSITESVVWDVNNADERTHIPVLIVKHLLQRHLGIGADFVQSWQSEFDSLLRAPESIRSVYEACGAMFGFKAALTAFDALVKRIKALDDQFPLAILNVSPVSSALRYTEVFVPVAVPLSSRTRLPTAASYLPAMEIVIEFEKSGRWPDDLRAIQTMKLAFFERLATLLTGSTKGLQASVVLGDKAERSEIQDEAALDIVTPDGWAFRARIHHDREATLLDRIINDRPKTKSHRNTLSGEEARERQAAIQAREVYTRRFILATRHHRAIATLSHKFAAFSGTVRLTKRWFASHWLLRGHVSEEAVELLCAYIFLRAGTRAVGDSTTNPVGIPATKERGFALVVGFLKQWDWTKGLNIPLDFGERHSTASERHVSAAGSAAWSLVTEFDPTGYSWTASGPISVVARRITALAKATCDALSNMEHGTASLKQLFQHPVDHYDFVVELNPAVVPRYYQALDANPSIWATKSKYANASGESTPSVAPGFDPVSMYYDDLKHIYGDAALIFYDPLGGSRIGGVWQPELQLPRPFRVLGGFSSAPVVKDGDTPKEKDSKGLVILNRTSLLVEIDRLGHTLVNERKPPFAT